MNLQMSNYLPVLSSGNAKLLFFLRIPCKVTASIWYLWKSPWLPEGVPAACDHIISSIVFTLCIYPSRDCGSIVSNWKKNQKKKIPVKQLFLKTHFLKKLSVQKYRFHCTETFQNIVICNLYQGLITITNLHFCEKKHLPPLGCRFLQQG